MTVAEFMQVVQVDARLNHVAADAKRFPEAHVELIQAGRRVVPRGSTVMFVVPCVSATVLLPTETCVSSGNPF